MAQQNLRSCMLACINGIVLLSLAGCSSLHINPAAEPPIVIIRNATSHNIQRVTLSGTNPNPRNPMRYGEISPVPQGASQTFIRPDDPTPFPQNLLVSWVATNGETRSQTVRLEELLKTSTGVAGEVLVFEITSSGMVRAYISKPE